MEYCAHLHLSPNDTLSVMRAPFAFLLIFFASCRAKSQDVSAAVGHRPFISVQSAPLEIHIFGLANFGAERSRARVARRWGFSYRAIAGCVVTKELMDSAARHNSVVETALAQKHGAGWKARFENEVESAGAFDTIIQKAALQNPVIATAQRVLDGAGKSLLFEPGEVRADGRVEVYAYAYDDWQGRPSFVTQYTLRVDTSNGHADVVNDNRWLFRTLE